MGVRLIAGRAGSGKTVWCQTQICEALTSSLTEGPRLVLLVPEQAAFQMERALLALSPASVLGRCEVLSFRRLAHRVLNDTAGPMPTPLTPTGRQMALRHLIGRHRKALREFGRVAERGGFVAAIARGIAELVQESVSVSQIEAAAAVADEQGDPTAARLHDAALLFGAYLTYLGTQRVDPEGVLDLARARVNSVPWLRNARIWVDGFAGLTLQQVRMITTLSQCATHLDIALLLDPARGRTRDTAAPPDDLSLFARTQRTWFSLTRALHEAGTSIEDPISLGRAGPPRFAQAESLARLERQLFTMPTKDGRASQTRRPEQTPGTTTQDEEWASGRSVRLVTAPDRRAEVAAAVRTLVDLVQRSENPLRYRDVAIVVRDLAPYHDLISAALRSNRIPFFIDRRRPTFHHPLVQAVRGALAMHGGGPFDQAVMTLLKSGMSGLADEADDALENYLLAHGLVSAEAWDEPWTYADPPGQRGEEAPAAARAALAAVNRSREQLRERIGAWWPEPAGQRARPSCGTWARRLYDLLNRLGAADRLATWSAEAVAQGDLDEAEENQQVWADLVKLLDELVEALGDERMTGRQFREVLESGLSTFTLGLVPATVDQVLVSSIERSRHPPVRAVFVLGLEDGLFPARVTEETIFGDDERLRLQACDVELGRTRAQQLLDERMLVYVAVTRPSEHLWISYPQGNEAGKPVSPSPYWAALQAALPEVPVEHVGDAGPNDVGTTGELAGHLALQMRALCEDRPRDPEGATWSALYEWARTEPTVSPAVAAAMAALGPAREARLSVTATSTLWPQPHTTSVTRLEQFARCPFQHYAARGLRLEPRAVHELSALQMGSLYHEILEQFVNELMETGRHLGDLTPGEIAGSISRWCHAALTEHAKEVRMEERESKKASWRSSVELPAALAGEQSAVGRTPLRPVATEQTFGTSEDAALPALTLTTGHGQVVSVCGKIDRLDVVQSDDVSLAVVFDYKRSLGRRLRLDEVYHGLALQLLAYLLVIRDEGHRLTGATLVPGGAFYLPLLGSFKKLDHPGEADEEDFGPYQSYKPRGVVDFDWIDSLDPSMSTGKSAAFQAQRTRKGEIAYLNRSDAVTGGSLPVLLDHVRLKMTELVDGWLAGDILPAPARLGKDMPCSHCRYRPVCRYEFALRQTRTFARMSRSRVLEELTGRAGGDHA